MGDSNGLNKGGTFAGLQFGHGGDAVGDARRESRSEGRKVRFNSATAVTPWVTPASGGGISPGLTGFNSATAVTPWVTAIGI